jgi:hypothetical protein
MNRDSVLSVYSDARAEYTKQLCVFLVPAYFQFFTDLLEKAKKSSEQKKVLWQFQTYLNEIHDWNMEKVNNEIHTINVNCGCDYLEDLLTAVFIAHTKVLTAIRLSSNNKKVEINIPKVEHFLFKVLCETSKSLWSSSYLFRDGISGIEKQQNYRNIEHLINEGILQAVRSLVPVKSILRDFVNNDNNDDKDDKDDKEDKHDKDEKDDEDEKDEEQELKKQKDLKESTDHSVSFDEIEPVKSEKLVNVSKAEEIDELPDKLPDKLPNKLPDNPPLIDELPATKVNEKHQTIIINDKPNVKFGEFNAIFDSDHPNDSEMLYESHDDIPDLQILDDVGTPLSDTIEFDTLDTASKSLNTDEYEVLS